MTNGSTITRAHYRHHDTRFDFTKAEIIGQYSYPHVHRRSWPSVIAQGHKNADIAARLFLSPKTVRNHVSNILAKLQVADRAGAIIRAREAGLGQTPP